MRARVISGGLGAVATAACLAGSAPALASAAVASPETFTVIVAGNAPQIFHAQGTIDATGTAVEVSMNGAGGGTDLVTLPGGSFMLTLQNTGGDPGSANQPACVSTFSGTGTSTIFDGTGRFAGIGGTGTYTFRGRFVSCSPQGTVIDMVEDQGTVTLP